MFSAVLSELRMSYTEWPDLVHLVQSRLNYVPSLQRRSLLPITIFFGQSSKSAVATLLRTETKKVVAIQDAVRERTMNLTAAMDIINDLHRVVREPCKRVESVPENPLLEVPSRASQKEIRWE